MVRYRQYDVYKNTIEDDLSLDEDDGKNVQSEQKDVSDSLKKNDPPLGGGPVLNYVDNASILRSTPAFENKRFRIDTYDARANKRHYTNDRYENANYSKFSGKGSSYQNSKWSRKESRLPYANSNSVKDEWSESKIRSEQQSKSDQRKVEEEWKRINERKLKLEADRKIIEADRKSIEDQRLYLKKWEDDIKMKQQQLAIADRNISQLFITLCAWRSSTSTDNHQSVGDSFHNVMGLNSMPNSNIHIGGSHTR